HVAGRLARDGVGVHRPAQHARQAAGAGDAAVGATVGWRLLRLRTYAALAGAALASLRASSTALATPSLRATAFTRVRSTPLSLCRAARYCPCRLRAARAFAVIVNFRLRVFTAAARGPAGRPAVLA